ncbi:MAG: branched-chain amino acid ABC transporter permease [Dehalococcoidia bacterium]|nr:branched-chain amino acid ABC transporter permease [Dehalococcoidia bacterium]
METATVLQSLISGLTLGCIYAALGLGLFVVYGVTRVLNLAQGEFVMLGGMLTVSFVSFGIPLVPAIVLAVFMTMLSGLFLYRFIIYPARHASGSTLAFLTVGFAFAIEGITLLVWGWEYRGLTNFLGSSSIHLWGATIFGQAPWVVGMTVLMVVGLFLFFDHTMTGKALRACADEPLGARSVGIDINRMALLAFVLASALGAVAGATITPLTMTAYNVGIPLTTKGLLAAFVGGIHRAEGVILGGLLVGFTEALSAGLMPSGYHDAIALGLLLVVFLARPRGLLPGRGVAE